MYSYVCNKLGVNEGLGGTAIREALEDKSQEDILELVTGVQQICTDLNNINDTGTLFDSAQKYLLGGAEASSIPDADLEEHLLRCKDRTQEALYILLVYVGELGLGLGATSVNGGGTVRDVILMADQQAVNTTSILQSFASTLRLAKAGVDVDRTNLTDTEIVREMIDEKRVRNNLSAFTALTQKMLTKLHYMGLRRSPTGEGTDVYVEVHMSLGTDSRGVSSYRLHTPKLVEKLLRKTNDKSEYRTLYDHVQLQSKHEGQVATYPTGSWVKLTSLKTALAYLCRSDVDAQAHDLCLDTPSNWKQVLDVLGNFLQEGKFEPVYRKRRRHSFANGVLFLPYNSQNRFHPPHFFTYQELADRPGSLKQLLESPLLKPLAEGCSIAYHKQVFDPALAQLSSYEDLLDMTPSFQRILDGQRLTPEVSRFVYAQFGRMLVWMNEQDNQQMILFLVGKGGTGKSTLLKVAQQFFNSVDVGTLSSNNEERFGLAQLLNKLMYVCPEVTKDMVKNVNMADFKSLIAGGEDIVFAQKFRDPHVGPNRIPGILCGNEDGGWDNQGGASERRLAIVEFNHRVDNVDPDLKDRLEDEKPMIMWKCYLAYLSFAQSIRHKNAWDVMPKELHEARQRFADSTDPVRNFVKNSGLITLRAYVLLTEFQKALRRFAREEAPGIDLVRESLEAMGYRVELTTKQVYGIDKTDEFVLGLALTDDLLKGDVNDPNDAEPPAVDADQAAVQAPAPADSVAPSASSSSAAVGGHGDEELQRQLELEQGLERDLVDMAGSMHIGEQPRRPSAEVRQEIDYFQEVNAGSLHTRGKRFDLGVPRKLQNDRVSYLARYGY